MGCLPDTLTLCRPGIACRGVLEPLVAVTRLFGPYYFIGRNPQMASLSLRSLALVAISAVSLSAYAVTAKICMDPGHGGSDPGAVGNGQQEKINNLNTQLKFNSQLLAD